MQCETMQEQISRLIDHELVIGEAQAVFSHLGSCAACAVFYSHAVVIGRRIRRTGDAGFPQELDARMRHAIGARSAVPQRPRRLMPERFRTFVGRRVVLPIPAAIAVFIVSLGISILLLRNFAPGLLPIERETKFVVAYPPVEVVADQSATE